MLRLTGLWNLLLKVEETVFVLVEVAEHVEALGLADVVDHVVLQELVDVVGRNFAQLHPVDALEGRPRLKAGLFGELLTLLLDDFFVLGYRPKQLENFVTSGLRQHF